MKGDYISSKKLKWKKIQGGVFEKECLVSKKGINISILKIEPGKKIGLHEHLDTRYNFILKGNMSDGERMHMKGDLVTNKKGSKHFLKAGSRGCEFLLIWTK